MGWVARPPPPTTTRSLSVALSRARSGSWAASRPLADLYPHDNVSTISVAFIFSNLLFPALLFVFEKVTPISSAFNEIFTVKNMSTTHNALLLTVLDPFTELV